MRGAALLTLGLGSALFPAAQAAAPSDADAWAACIWSTAPQTASNWLEAPPGDPFSEHADDLYANLAIRVRSACGPVLKGRDFEPELVRTALSRTRPADPGEDATGVVGYVCEYRSQGVVRSVMRSSGHPDTPNAPGGIVMAEPLGERECRKIAEDGALSPMRPYRGKDDA
jgi:hypothetical protein